MASKVEEMRQSNLSKKEKEEIKSLQVSAVYSKN
jgi:hypothetical protein